MSDCIEGVKQDLKKYSAEACWQRWVANPLMKTQPFDIHQQIYRLIYPDYLNEPGPAWHPQAEQTKATHICQLMHELNIHHYTDFLRFSCEHYADFWGMMVRKLDIVFDQPYRHVVDVSQGITHPQWFPGGKLNIVNSCFTQKPDATAILYQTEGGKIEKTSYASLHALANQVANGLQGHVQVGDKIAIVMPMSVSSVAIYLGIIQAGCTVVAIPESFSTAEIALRIKLTGAKWLFTQDVILRGNKALPLYEKIQAIETGDFHSIAVPAKGKLQVSLQAGDLAFDDFLSPNKAFKAVSCDPGTHTTILFSSGTTGEPKCIPWTQTTGIKSASDAYLHHNVSEGDIFCWPTSLGWMMGSWLVYSCLINGATMALYDGASNSREFGQFIVDAGVTHLGVVPTSVKGWRHSGCMEGLDWHKIKLFSSTGECSNCDDMLYLMWLAGYRPIIEYCGGTETGGGYVTSTLLDPSRPSLFTTSALGLGFVILDENGQLTEDGEVALVPPSIGLSTELLNRDHFAVYYKDMPSLAQHPHLRRHGDHVIKLKNGLYRMEGRLDDTMNLGGIKVSSVEIERVLNVLPHIFETAALGVKPTGGGPSKLVVYVVLEPGEPLSDLETLKTSMQTAIKKSLNPLFKIDDVVMVKSLPRTASNKIMRRVLQDEYTQGKK